MINKEDKKYLLELIDTLGNDNKFWKNNNSDNKNKIGSTNVRSVANIARDADSYDELRLYIKYKIAKGNGWQTTLSNGKVFGEAIIEDMDKIFIRCNENEKISLDQIALYFGYLYWKKTSIEKLLEAKNDRSNSRGNYNDNYNNNNNNRKFNGKR